VKLKIDENLPDEAADPLRSAGHDVETARSEGLAGSPDERIAEVCRAEGRALVTLDTDFGNVRAFPPADYPGIVVLRPPSQDKPTVLQTVSQLIALLAREPLDGRLWIVEERRVRIRE
jgi:predicted nuclease of predicted toxin-antitoxin system